MPRRRLGVALLLPPPWAHEVDGLRRACGDRQLGRVPPHCTLVPPVNVREDDVPAALAIVREAATKAVRSMGPLVDLRLGPPATFHPASPTLHLAVDDEAGAVRALRDAVFAGPLRRDLTWPFVPHVTLADEIDEARARAAIAALADFVATVPVDRVHVLEQRSDPVVGRCWVPIADAPFRVPVIVGRGGIEVELSTSTLVDPEAARLVPAPAPTPGGRTVVITARRAGRVVGALTGWTRDGEHEVVDRFVVDDHRDMGIGRHLVAAFEGHAAEDEP